MVSVFRLLLVVGASMFVAAARAAMMELPHHHPIHHAPADLLARIRRSNPAALSLEHTLAGSMSQHPDPETRRSLSAILHSKSPRHSGNSANAPVRVTPTAFGGDPTGQKDSWEALNACIQHCLNQSALSPNGFFPGYDTTPQFGPIRDMGGCDVNLEGGEYRISKPLVLPEMNANMQFGHGSLVASPDFQGDFLFVIGEKGGCKFPQGSCNIDINFPMLFLDGARVTSGMQINDVMGVTIGPGGYFLNFTEFGLQINAGHEVMMDRCWLGETNFDFDHKKLGMAPNATAIQINGNDHYILNSIIFSSRVGVEVHGAADYVAGVHVWFPVNHAVAFPNTAAFHIFGSGNRFSGNYIDGGRGIFDTGALSRNVWTHGFECCQGAAAAAGTTASGITLVGKKIGSGLQIVHNEFGGGTIYHIDELWPTFYSSGNDSRNCTAELNVSSANLDCEGMSHSTAGSASLDACAAACCKDTSCTVYQFCPEGGNCEGATGAAAQCWTGQAQDCSGTRTGWQGMGSNIIPTPSSSYAAVNGVLIEHNSFSGTGVGTRATQAMNQTNAKVWTFDFCDSLVFKQIALVRAHVMAETGFPHAVARPTSGCTVTVETDVAFTGTMIVDVDSSFPDAGFV